MIERGEDERCCPTRSRCEDCRFSTMKQDGHDLGDRSRERSASSTSCRAQTHACAGENSAERLGLATTRGLVWALLIAAAFNGACERKPAPQQGPQPAPTTSAMPAETEPAAAAPRPAAVPPKATTPAPVASAPATRTAETSDGVMAYYFHRTLRCPTCLSIEKQAKEAIEAGFAGEMADGVLTWRAVNIETQGNGHFEQDFEIDRQTLMFVEWRGGKAVRSAKPERVWELVEDPVAFQTYVQQEMRAFLGGA